MKKKNKNFFDEKILVCVFGYNDVLICNEKDYKIINKATEIQIKKYNTYNYVMNELNDFVDLNKFINENVQKNTYKMFDNKNEKYKQKLNINDCFFDYDENDNSFDQIYVHVLSDNTVLISDESNYHKIIVKGNENRNVFNSSSRCVTNLKQLNSFINDEIKKNIKEYFDNNDDLFKKN